MKKISIAILALITILVACKKTPEVNLKYVDVERELITVGVTTATVQCDYQYITTLKKAFFYYGEGANETDMGLAEMRVVQNTLYVDLTGLKENTTYSYYYEFVNGFNSMRSETKTFKTEASPIVPPEITVPTVVTAMVTEITTNSAMGGGEVTDDGGGEVTERGICWGANVNPSLSDNHIAVGSGLGSFTALMESLEANTVYHVRAYATNEAGTAYGLDRGFTTLSGGVAELPVVITNEVTGITAHSASCSGEVTSDGGAMVAERGFCWSTNANPTVADSHISSGSGTGTYSSSLTGLAASTTYHVRAYATNSVGTAYGLDREFTTSSGGGSGEVPTGAINGLFTINEQGDQVYFSQGNLQYQASTNTWRFAENQWDFVGGEWTNQYGTGQYGTVYENGIKCDNSLISSTYDGWIDLFGWGTSGWNNGNVYYHPYDYEYDEGYGGYGPTDGICYEYDLNGIYANADWGVYNSISNGGDMTCQWRTLTMEEWVFVFNTRSTSNDFRYVNARVNDVNGVILLPDNWSAGTYPLDCVNQGNESFDTNVITATQWANLQNAGAVFLPVTGRRWGTFVEFIDSEGYYYSASHYRNLDVWEVNFGYVEQGDQFVYPAHPSNRFLGDAVRLVQDANK